MNTHLPDFSVVVPTYNRPQQLATCLAALAQLAYPPDRFEVIVVDDGGNAPLEPLVAPLRQRITITLHRQANAGPASARNAGAPRARGAFLAFTDDDCAPAPDWLACLAAQLDATPDALVGGRTCNALAQNLCAAASQTLVAYLTAYECARGPRAGFAASNNIALATRAFHGIGGFDTSFPLAAGEDREFCDRWLATGRAIVHAPDAVVAHRHYLRLATFWRQHFNYGRGAFQLRRMRADRVGQSLRLERAQFYAGLLCAPFGQKRVIRGAIVALLLGVAQFATMFGFLAERWRWTKLVEARTNERTEIIH